MNSPPADQQFPAELLQLQKSELFQWNLSNVGLNVALRFTMVFTVWLKVKKGRPAAALFLCVAYQFLTRGYPFSLFL